MAHLMANNMAYAVAHTERQTALGTDFGASAPESALKSRAHALLTAKDAVHLRAFGVSPRP